MTEITSISASECGRHFLRRIIMTNKKWIVAGAIVALLYMAWTALPLGSSAAQTSTPPVPALVAGPVTIKGTPRTPSSVAVSTGERAVLMVINVGDEPIPVRIAIRDATNFARILASTEKTLEPWVVEILPYVEQDGLFRNAVGIVSPVRASGPEPWAVASGFKSLVASLSVVDDSTNTTRYVVGTNIVAIRSSGEPTVGRR